MTGCKQSFDFALNVAVRCLRAGGVVAHATEGVWGLACDPFNAHAVGRILELKGRALNKGLIVAGANAGDFKVELGGLDARYRAQVENSWPGAVTWLLPNVRFPMWITGGRATVACRVPGHAQARELTGAFGAPLVSTSANPHGLPAARSIWQVRRWFQNRAVLILHGETLGRQGPSEIRTLEGKRER
ncbi:MAG: L-threonylcarbamoyladenylate synthase [Pseudomonadales bacterium]|jgi:L-threonylcarbamoyladenylate synthase|nr:L-threonylcarbamoyladenylate synthase [Pseudomonadales bacterium]MDP6471441.1 L-threonylcarbamoyladenylate synthase [Pseudomonadales bacterium]MDP6828610.1 L-threonylcarbamoyladenylate synthase [Pseudomonadales bacterium]MDP6973207.1 L-threonylcarbamoyladenylate synthase [Pseudomonadales bacterium]